jgi:hypothetical protein
MDRKFLVALLATLANAPIRAAQRVQESEA